MTWTSRILSSLALAAVASTASADPTMSAAAKAEFKKGNASLKQRDYVAAIAAFDAGYAIDPNPAFLYVKGQAQRLGGDCRAAVGTYKAFLATNPAPKAVQYTQKNITACERILATSPVATPGDPKPVETEPTDIEDNGFAEPTRDTKPTVKPPLREREPMRVDRPGPTPWYRDRLGLTFAISGVVMLGTGVTFTLLARNDVDDAFNSFDLNEWRDANSAWERDRTVAGIGYGLGVALVGAAVIRFALVGDHGSSGPAIGASATPGGGAVILGGRW